MKPITLTVATKKIDGVWHAAVITNDSFTKSYMEKNIEQLVQKALLGTFIDRPEGTSMNVTVNILLPEAEDGPTTPA
jgi:hypothetical protein